MKNNWIGILTVGITLGTAWAVRGQFGHSQGAAWAGGIAALVMVLVSQRKDWYKKIFTITLSCALGWGAGGMISYGLIIGYGRSDSFPNVLYGLLMLLVIGGLYGMLGGGLTGLSLQSTTEKKVKWAQLISEMAAGGLITYFFLIVQVGVRMTPPRSEAWAVCLGAALALLWHMARKDYSSSLRVAVISGLGGGFGFAFGNFLQTIGVALEINFNMWNVMEYSIGFFGGTSMAYGIFSSEWPEQAVIPEKWESRAAFGIAFIFIPLIIYRQSVQYSRLVNRLGDIANLETITIISSTFAAVLFISMIIAVGVLLYNSRVAWSRNDIMIILISYFGVFIITSYIITGAFAGRLLLTHHLYVANFLVIIYLLVKRLPIIFALGRKDFSTGHWPWYLGGIVLFIIILSIISVNVHNGLPGANLRFPAE
jgi:hypothetical protein